MVAKIPSFDFLRDHQQLNGIEILKSKLVKSEASKLKFREIEQRIKRMIQGSKWKYGSIYILSFWMI